jgi:hypothetical protein
MEELDLTRFANKLYGDLIDAGVSPNRVCRLDTLHVGSGVDRLTARLLAGEMM